MRDTDKVRQAIRSLGGVEFTSKTIKAMLPDMPYIPQMLRDLCVRRKELKRGEAKFSYIDDGVKAPRQPKQVEQVEQVEQAEQVQAPCISFRSNGWASLGRMEA